MEYQKTEIKRGSIKKNHNMTVKIQLLKSSVQFSSVQSFSRVRLFATLWTVSCQAPLSMGFSRQACWSGLPCPSPEDLPGQGIEPGSPALQADSLLSEAQGFSCRSCLNMTQGILSVLTMLPSIFMLCLIFLDEYQ